MKKFFTRVPLQPKGKLEKYLYHAKGNSRLQMDKETRFPILTAINGYCEDNEEIEVYAIINNTEAELYNYELFCSELNEIVKEKNLICKSGAQKIEIEGEQDVIAQTNLFQKLIDVVTDDDELYACMTFGTKPQTTVMQMAIQYAYRIKKNTSISCLLYGEVVRPENESWYGNVYDMTALVQLDELVNVLATQKVENPKEIIRTILSV